MVSAVELGLVVTSQQRLNRRLDQRTINTVKSLSLQEEGVLSLRTEKDSLLSAPRWKSKDALDPGPTGQGYRMLLGNL